MEKNSHSIEIICEICSSSNPHQMICHKCTNEFLTKSQTLKKYYISENNASFQHLSILLSSFNEKKFKSSIKKQIDIKQLDRDVLSKKSIIQRNENLIAILKEKKLQIKENIDKLKESINNMKKQLDIEYSQDLEEKSKEKNAMIVISNIRKATFSLVIEYYFYLTSKIMEFSQFHSKKYFYFMEYIISDLKNFKETQDKQSIKSFSDLENVLSTRRISVDVNKLNIQNNDIKSIRIKTSLPSKDYDKFNEYVYKLTFVINKLSVIFNVWLPNIIDENTLTIKNHFSDRKPDHIYFNPNNERNNEIGFILLDENIRHLKNFLTKEQTSPRFLDLSEFLNIKSISSTNLILQAKKSEEKISSCDEDYNKFMFIENYFA